MQSVFSVKVLGLHTKSHIAVIILCSIFILAGLIVDIVFGINIYRKNNNLTDVHQTQGTVVSYEVVDHFNNGSGKYEERYNYKAEYVYNGKTYYVETILKDNDYSVGNKVTVEFNINKLYDAKIIDKNFAYYLGQYLPIIIGSVFILIGTIGVVIKIKRIINERNGAF